MNCRVHNFNSNPSQTAFWTSFSGMLSSGAMTTTSNSAPLVEGSAAPMEEKVVRTDLRMAREDCAFETTADGDVMVVQRSSFDDGCTQRSRTPTGGGFTSSSEWQQSRSPDGDMKQTDSEERNPSSPQSLEFAKPKAQQQRGGHHRSLSGRFFESTTISDEPTEQVKGDSPEHAASRKHRRMFSGDTTNPNNAHCRITSS